MSSPASIPLRRPNTVEQVGKADTGDAFNAENQVTQTNGGSAVYAMMVTLDADELRSVNGQIEYILRQAAARRSKSNGQRQQPPGRVPEKARRG